MMLLYNFFENQCHSSDIAAVGIFFNVFIYDVVLAKLKRYVLRYSRQFLIIL